MLSTFPTLLSFSFLAIFLIRITAGFLFVRFGWLKLTKDKKAKLTFFKKIGLRPEALWLWFIAVLEIVVGVMIFVGFLTQISAIIASLVMLASIIIKIFNTKALPNTLDFYILFFIVFVFLIFSGAGPFAFDLPL